MVAVLGLVCSSLSSNDCVKHLIPGNKFFLKKIKPAIIVSVVCNWTQTDAASH